MKNFAQNFFEENNIIVNPFINKRMKKIRKTQKKVLKNSNLLLSPDLNENIDFNRCSQFEKKLVYLIQSFKKINF